jgi:hypothetical protein
MKKIYWALVAVVAITLALAYSPISLKNIRIITANKPEIKAQVAYALKYYDSPNKKVFGDLGSVDCANFTSQTLFARGWHMTNEWKHEVDNGKQFYTRAWISSTVLHDYIQNHHLAKALTWEQRDQVQVGDVVQFDWDNSGDRDHSAIVSGILDVDGNKELLLAEHSRGAFNFPISALLALHLGPTKVYFWHLGGS